MDGVTLTVAPGETFALVGESGCGKSTLATLILKLNPLSGGRITFAGEDVGGLRGRAAKRYRSRVQAVFQDPYSSLNPRLKVRTILAEPLLAHGTPRRDVAAKVSRALSLGRPGAECRGPLSARVLRRAAAAHRHCQGADPGTGPRRPGRADLGLGRVHPRPDPEPAEGTCRPNSGSPTC